MNNVIYNDDEIIGRYEDLWKYTKEEIKRQLDDNNLGFDEMKINIDMFLELFEELESEEKAIADDSLFRITYNPMGNYEYKVLNENE